MMVTLQKEITDNNFKVFRWIVQAVLADVDQVKFAFITRNNMKEVKKGHQVVATTGIKTQSMLQQFNMSMDHLWKVLRHVVNTIEESNLKSKGEGEEMAANEYVIIKDNNKGAVKLYKKDIQDEEEGEQEQEEGQ